MVSAASVVSMKSSLCFCMLSIIPCNNREYGDVVLEIGGRDNTVVESVGT